jgi:hypothetical protein
MSSLVLYEQNMNKPCTKLPKIEVKNCEILPKRGKVYKKHNETLVILGKM